MILAGIDEAGLGPALGPLCVGCAALRLRTEHAADAPWQLLETTVARHPKRGEARLLVTDSKKAHKKNSLAPLERTVFAFLDALHDLDGTPLDRQTFFQHLYTFDALDAMEATPWYRDAPPWRLPGCVKTDMRKMDGDGLRQALYEAETQVVVLQTQVLTASMLNRRFDGGANKSEVALATVGRHLKGLADAFPDEDLMVTIDRQGGRTDYLPFLFDLFPGGWVDTLVKSDAASAYEIRRAGGRLCVRFAPKADGDAFCVALASMAAKYLRERCMEDLNHYFRARVDDLQPTAGYHGDAPRFLAAVEPVLRAEGIDRTMLVRNR